MEGLIRQGDIIFVPVKNGGSEGFKSLNALRKQGRTLRRRKGEGVIVAEGEVTGHHHRIRTSKVRRFQVGTRVFLDVTNTAGAELTHEEHDTLLIPKGLYRIVNQREYVPAAAPSQRPQERRVYD